MNDKLRNVSQYGTAHYSSTNFQFDLIDFSIVIHDVSPCLRSRLRHFRDALIRRFSLEEECSTRKFKWIIILIWPQIYPEVIEFLRSFASETSSYTIAFVSIGNSTESSMAEFRRHSFDNIFFSFDENESNYETIFNYLEKNDDIHRVRISHRTNNSCWFPLQLHANSISSGLCFNYFYSYLNRQIGSTNNIVLFFTFNRHLSVDRFPQYLIVQFTNQIEEFFPYSYSRTVRQIWNPIRLNFDSSAYRIENERETIVKYFVTEIGDLGKTIETLQIFSTDFPVDDLKTIQLNDDVRRWNFFYDGPGRIDRDALIFHQRHEEFLHQCQFYSRTLDVRIGQTIGVCTMKKTSEDTLSRYKNDQPTIREIRMIPKYYIIALSSCHFGSMDLDGSYQHGIIREENIQLARLSNGDVLQSPRMHHYARYLCRTYYYFDAKDNENETIRYLFCAEYPFILSTLYQMEQQGLITRQEKREEYLRFCNMLNQLLTSHQLNDSITLIDYDDELCSLSIADSPSICEIIRKDIEGYYHQMNNPLDSIDTLLRIDEAKRLVQIYSTDQSLTNFIEKLNEKLQMKEYHIVDYDEQAEQTIFICTNNREENEKIMEQVVKKMNERQVFRDVFVFVDRAIEDFPVNFIQLVPFIRIDRENIEENKIDEVIEYLEKMNILSRNYADEPKFSFSPSEQVTSIGIGCAAALYFNYIQIVAQHPQHRQRIDSIEHDFNQDRIHRPMENQAIFIRHWLFVLPWTIENSARLINDAMREENQTDFQLSIWKKTDLTVSITVGGIVNRSYSPLTIYRLASVNDRRTFYFPMEIPQAMIALQNRYEEIQSQFHFGRFDPEKQAENFQENLLEYQRRDTNDRQRNEILLLPLIKSENQNSDEEQAKVLLKSLWDTLIGL